MKTEKTPTPKGQTKIRKRLLPMALTFLVSMATWLILSGQFDAFHISLGILSSGIVAYFSGDLLFGTAPGKNTPATIYRFALYIPWLLLEVFIANLHVLKLVFDPKMMDRIDPRIVKFKSRLSGHMPLFVFGNSITLTPGTVTIFVNVFGTYTVHAIDERSAEALPGEMEKKIERIFKNQ